MITFLICSLSIYPFAFTRTNTVEPGSLRNFKRSLAKKARARWHESAHRSPFRKSMFFSGRQGWRRVAQPFLVSNTVHGAAWCLVTGERRGAASVPISSFFAGLCGPLSFALRHLRIHRPNPAISFFLPHTGLSLSLQPSCTKPVRSFVRSFLATISTSARLRLDIDIHWRMLPLEYSLLEAPRASSFTHASYPARLDSTPLHSLARSLAKFAPLPRPFSSTFHSSTSSSSARPLLNTVNNRRKEPLPVCKACARVRPWLRLTYRPWLTGRCELHSTGGDRREIRRINAGRREGRREEEEEDALTTEAAGERSRFLNIPIG